MKGLFVLAVWVVMVALSISLVVNGYQAFAEQAWDEATFWAVMLVLVGQWAEGLR